MEFGRAKIIEITRDGINIFMPYQNIQRAVFRKYSEVFVGLPDGRTITPAQRRKSYALINAISEWSGYTPVEVVKEMTKLQFSSNRTSFDNKIFSLSNCSITTARGYITFLIDFIVKNNIPTGDSSLADLCEDINKYIYACLMNKICAVCGKPAQLHHVKRVGMGRNRHTINHLKMLVLPLCGIHHIECHDMPQDEFNKKHHIVAIPLTEEIGKLYTLTKSNLEEQQRG